MDMPTEGKKEKKAVVFDMDGVLFDTEAVCMKSWMAVAEQNGLKDMEKVFPRCIGLNSNDSRQIVAQAYGEDFDYPRFREQAARWQRDYLEKNGLPVKPGMEEILAWLGTSDYAVGLASSTRSSSVFSHLDQAGIRDCFSVVVTGDMVEHSKPKPDIYLLACGRLGVEPQNAWAIEDSPNGIRSAYSAGMGVIMVPDMIPPDEETKRLSRAVVKDLLEAMAFLKKMQKTGELYG